MGLYIEGMEMPKRGMVVNIYADGRVTNHFDEFGKTIGKAVPVPPHGRLIDADKLHEATFHRAFETGGDTMWQSGCWVRYRAIEQVQDSQPTIIEAEEET